MKKLLLITVLFSSIKINAQTLQWADAMVGPAAAGGEAKSVVVDASGNVYSVGSYSGTTDFDPGPGTFTIVPVAGIDIFVSKLDAAGNFVWAKSFGVVGNDLGQSITLDASGNIYFTGNFAPGTGFIIKLDAAGNTVWTKYTGSGGSSITIDALGNIYTTGGFTGTPDFDPGTGTFTLTATAGSVDSYVSKLDPSGNFIWAKGLGGSQADSGFGIDVDASGNVYTTGYFTGTADFDPGAGVSNLSTSPYTDAYISKLDASGNFVWAKQKSSFYGSGSSIVVDATGNSYVGGLDLSNGFISKLDAAGNFVWTKNIGNNALSVTLDGAGNVYSTGYFQGTVDFDPGAGTYTVTSAGSRDAFISKLNSSGNFIAAGAMGGATDDRGNSIACDATGNAHVAGYFNGTADFDPGTGVFNLIAPGTIAGYIYVTKLSLLTGIKEESSFNMISVYPNPSSGLFTIHSENNQESTIEVINVLGETVYTERISSLNEKTDLQHLPNGMYSVRISGKGRSSTGKIIIQK